jgi:hypothetical protein
VGCFRHQPAAGKCTNEKAECQAKAVASPAAILRFSRQLPLATQPRLKHVFYCHIVQVIAECRDSNQNRIAIF